MKAFLESRTHFDLFSGIGGFALAARWAGWQTIGFSEIDPYACKILKRHWPDVPNYGDIRNVPGIACDLITGGFPCQPFSLVGKRRGKTDDRYLWPEMLRVIAECKPTWVLAENVPGIIGMELDQVLSDLEGQGYEIGTLVVPACAVDAPHRRNRVWIVANAASSGLRDDCQVQAGGEQSWRDTASGRRSIGYTSHAAERDRDPRCRWLPEPDVGRVAHGIPSRVDRLRALGNAIVPQVAAVLMDAMARRHDQK